MSVREGDPAHSHTLPPSVPFLRAPPTQARATCTLAPTFARCYRCRSDENEWDKLRGVFTFLQESHEIPSDITLSALPNLYKLLKLHCEKTINGNFAHCISNECKFSAQTMMGKLDSYGELINSDVVTFSKLLDPRFINDDSVVPKFREILTHKYGYVKKNPSAISTCRFL